MYAYLLGAETALVSSRPRHAKLLGPRCMPRPRSLTAQAIAQAALAIVDREGLEQLSMRTVASELSVGTMSLYRYVSSRDELIGLVMDEAVGGVDLTVAGGAGWRERVELLVQRVRKAIRAHPAVVPLLLTRRHSSSASLRWGEAMLNALKEAGLEGSARALAFRALLSYLVGAVQVEHYGPLSGAGTQAIAQLSPAEFPCLAEAAQLARRVSVDDEFQTGLDLLLSGLTQPVRVAKPEKKRKSRSARG
jgi:AcrR family transcriptional regulator